MQLRVPKKYQARKRRRQLFRSKRWMYLWALTIGLGLASYWVILNPLAARQGMENFGENFRNQVSQAQDRFFPTQPTPTPDVADELIEAENAYRLGEMEQAIDLYWQVIQGRPNDVLAHYRLAHTLVITSSLGTDQARINEALRAAQLTINADPESPLGWAIQAMALDWAGQPNRALGSAERALELDPNSLIVKAYLANIYRNLEQNDLAETTINEAIAQLQREGGDNETIAQVYRNYGRILANKADFEGAAEAYRRARQAMPNQTYITVELAKDIYYPLGIANGDPAQINTAISLLEETLDANPRDAPALYWAGTLYRFQGNTESAMEKFRLCLIANSQYVPCLSQLGQLEFHSNSNYAQASEYLRQATELNSPDPYDWFLLARAYYQLQQCDRVEPILRQGYALFREVGALNGEVAEDDFIRAFRDCNLPAPA